MGIQIASSGTPPVSALPPWLRAFEHFKIAPAGKQTLSPAGNSLLVYVVDGVLDLPQDPPALRRSLPGELAVLQGFDTIELGNGSHVEELDVCVFELTGKKPDSRRIASRYFPDDSKSGAFAVMANQLGDGGALAHGHKLQVSLSALGRADRVVYQMASSAQAWACAVVGCVTINEVALESGQSALISEVEDLRVSTGESGQVLLIEEQQG